MYPKIKWLSSVILKTTSVWSYLGSTYSNLMCMLSIDTELYLSTKCQISKAAVLLNLTHHYLITKVHNKIKLCYFSTKQLWMI